MTIIGKLLNPGSRPRPTRKHPSKLLSAFSGSVAGALAGVDGNLRRYQNYHLRFQKEWVTIFLAGLVILVIIAGLSLNISARRAITGREIQSLQENITTNERVNSDLRTNIAELLSSKSLQQRAEADGFVPVENTDLNYLAVPGYFSNQGVNLASQAPQADDNEIPAEYSESLFTWIAHQLETASLPLANAH